MRVENCLFLNFACRKLYFSQVFVLKNEIIGTPSSSPPYTSPLLSQTWPLSDLFHSQYFLNHQYSFFYSLHPSTLELLLDNSGFGWDSISSTYLTYFSCWISSFLVGFNKNWKSFLRCIRVFNPYKSMWWIKIFS